MKITKTDPKLAEYKDLIPGNIVQNPKTKLEYQILQKTEDMIVLSAARQDHYPFFRQDRYARAVASSIFHIVCADYIVVGHVIREPRDRF